LIVLVSFVLICHFKRRPGKAPSSCLPAMNAPAKMDNVRFTAQRCAKRVRSSTEIQLSNGQFSAECKPPVPARKAMLVRSRLSGSGC